MTVKELKLYCTAMPDIKDTEALQEFMDKERAGTHKVACIKIGIAIGFAIAFSLVIFAFCGKISLESLKNILPFCFLCMIYIGIVVITMLLHVSNAAKKLEQAIQAGSGIRTSKHLFLLDEISKEKKASDKKPSTIYHFTDEQKSSANFYVSKQQVNCFFDQTAKGVHYKLYCLQDKYIFFLASDTTELELITEQNNG